MFYLIQGIELNPSNGNLLIHRALLQLQRTGDVVAAAKEIQRAIQVGKENNIILAKSGATIFRIPILRRSKRLKIFFYSCNNVYYLPVNSYDNILCRKLETKARIRIRIRVINSLFGWKVPVHSGILERLVY